MGIFKKIGGYFRGRKLAKAVKLQIHNWSRQLSVFQIIPMEQLFIQETEGLRGCRRYEALLHAFDEAVKDIAEHNKKINMLQNRFDSILLEHPIKEILLHIDTYTAEQLRSFNKTACDIGEFTIPESFSQKKQYLSYMRDLGELIDDYPKVVEQHSLLRDFDAISFSFGDRYIDGEAAREALAPAREILEKIKSYGSKYYAIPQLDEKIVERHNEQYILDHLNDAIFNDINGKSLDEEQRRAVLCDPRSSLTIAGAGAGKTLTICGKVKWLLDTGKVKEDEILLLSYSKASADDLAKKVAFIHSGLTVKTFHSFGLGVLNRAYGGKRAVEDQFKVYIKKFFDEEFKRVPQLVNTIFRFFSFYLYADNDEKRYATEGEKYEALKTADFRTLKDRLSSYSEDAEKLETLQKEYVKSYEELVIANFLYANGIAYEYERAYVIKTATPDKRQYTPDFYLPEYNIYLEHYGINENGRAPQYTKEEEKNYLAGIEWKRKTHMQNNTVCIETFSYEFKNGQIFDHLRRRLEENGVRFKPLSRAEIINALHLIYQGQEFGALFNLIATFINLYKAQYSDETGFLQLRKRSFPSVYDRERADVFLSICQEVYRYYISRLREEEKIDFDDMILQATEAIKEVEGYRYKYVIVDEFQDISQSRTKLLQAILRHGDAKLFAVGDDWQAIYRFAGCDISIFLQFERYFEDAKLNYITSTHRNSAELQTVVEPFITANPEQFIKHIRSEKHEKTPVRIIYHDDDRREAFLQALQSISKLDAKAEVLVLGRNRRDIETVLGGQIRLLSSGELVCERFPQMKLMYKTVHQSKGLEGKYVVLISGENAKNGFPNKMEDDRLLDMVLGAKSSFEFAEERRLFYVALTRTRSVVFILSDRGRPSVFVKEIEERAQIEALRTKDRLLVHSGYFCPRCKSGRLILRTSKANKEAFYGCSNYPYCKYTINDLKAVSRNNRCPDCGDFLVVRSGRYGKFISCHNYPYCKFKRELQQN